MLKDTDTLITGDYGTVGRRVAADLAPEYPGRLVVAGRSAENAAQLATELGHGVRGRTRRRGRGCWVPGDRGAGRQQRGCAVGLRHGGRGDGDPLSGAVRRRSGVRIPAVQF